jgi:hypothetical protein
MKLTKSKLKEIIREEIQKLDEEAQGYKRALDKFLKFANKKYTAQYKKDYPKIFASGAYKQIAVLKPGKKYDRVVDVNANEPKKPTSVHAFIERETGDIYKAAGYNKPAKGARASIFDPNSYKHADAHGAWLYKRR